MSDTNKLREALDAVQWLEGFVELMKCNVEPARTHFNNLREALAASKPEPQAQAAEPESEDREFWINVCEGLDEAKRRPSYEHLMLAYREECRKFQEETLRASQLSEAIAQRDAALDACVEALREAKSRLIEQGGSGWKTDVQRCVNAITKAQEARKS